MAARGDGVKKTQGFTLNLDANRETILANALRFIQSLPSDKAWQIDIGHPVKSRTNDQNAALFAAYKPLMEFMGLRGEREKEELHRHFCGEWFGWVDLPIGRKPKRTTTTDENGKRDVIGRQEFADFFSEVQRQGAELGVYIPDPDPSYRLNKGG